MSDDASISFSLEAQHVLALARREAEQLHHAFVATEHLLLALLEDRQGLLFEKLQNMNLRLETVRSAVLRVVRPGPDNQVAANVPYTPRVKAALKWASHEVERLKQPQVGAEHLLLGLLHEDQGLAVRVLEELRVPVEQLRGAVLEALGQHEAGRKAAPPKSADDELQHNRDLQGRGGAPGHEAGPLDLPEQLPDYFIADLPESAQLTPDLITEACYTLKRNRERYLAGRSTEATIRVLDEVGRSWLDPDFHFRRAVLATGPERLGFSRETLASGMDSFFHQLTAKNLRALVLQDLGHLRRLDELTASEEERKNRQASSALGPALLVHISGGVLPDPVLTSLVLGLLAGSAQFVKCARGTSFVPRMFAHSLYQLDPKLGSCIEISEWRGGTEDLESALFAEAECLTATGSDETLEAIARRLPARTRFLRYGHRLSFAYVTQEALSGGQVERVAQQVAVDIAAWDQLGCLSPHVIYVEDQGTTSPEDFAEALADALESLEQSQPRGSLRPEDASAISYRRSFYQMRHERSVATRIWASQNSTAWTVVYEEDPRFQTSCLNRFIYVKPVSHLTHALESTDAYRGHVSTVGLAAPEETARHLANTLARWGATRVCPVGQMQKPPLTWRHDGRPALADLVTWTDWER